MKVLFDGGPMHGMTREIAAPVPEPNWPVYWSIPHDVEVGPPGDMATDVAEYLYKGNGVAEYVAGGTVAVEAETQRSDA